MENKKLPLVGTSIEWDMLDKNKFFPFSILSSFVIKTTFYPLTLVRIRLQVQKGSSLYRGTWDAFKKIYKYEGGKGLYKGFCVNVFSIVSGAFYVLTYENVRHILYANNITDSRLRALIGGGSASLVAQTIIVPVDVVSQRLMVIGQTIDGINHPVYGSYSVKSRFQVAAVVALNIYHRDGVQGFYRGYTASLFTSSALWWAFYHLYHDNIYGLFPSWFPPLGVQCTSAVLGGVTTTTLINPIDIIRTRLQVQRLDSISQAFQILWKEERWRMFTKGLTARMIQSTFYSFSFIIGYKSVKRFSIEEEFREQINW